ncbi:hypothetical protein [Salipiger abyssi]|uniref:hypothetical protein n=1 Tax=Salipiger abyssi TaxID=1250539 RepID=UPI001A907524|nr:hypothetical protein [Salipiger abyssi]MBN9888584.1 hypothetical protein [Salipiger abyssi]
MTNVIDFAIRTRAGTVSKIRVSVAGRGVGVDAANHGWAWRKLFQKGSAGGKCGGTGAFVSTTLSECDTIYPFPRTPSAASNDSLDSRFIG